jgi:hypothetical protein
LFEPALIPSPLSAQCDDLPQSSQIARIRALNDNNNPKNTPPLPDSKINPQPLPPRVDLGELTTAVTQAVRDALESRPATANTPLVFRNPHIIIGIIIDPTLGGVSAAELGRGGTVHFLA